MVVDVTCEASRQIASANKGRSSNMGRMELRGHTLSKSDPPQRSGSPPGARRASSSRSVAWISDASHIFCACAPPGAVPVGTAFSAGGMGILGLDTYRCDNLITVLLVSDTRTFSSFLHGVSRFECENALSAVFLKCGVVSRTALAGCSLRPPG